MTVNRNYKSFQLSVYYMKRQSSKKITSWKPHFSCQECDRVGSKNWKRKQDNLDFPQRNSSISKVCQIILCFIRYVLAVTHAHLLNKRNSPLLCVVFLDLICLFPLIYLLFPIPRFKLLVPRAKNDPIQWSAGSQKRNKNLKVPTVLKI